MLLNELVQLPQFADDLVSLVWNVDAVNLKNYFPVFLQAVHVF